MINLSLQRSLLSLPTLLPQTTYHPPISTSNEQVLRRKSVQYLRTIALTIVRGIKADPKFSLKVSLQSGMSSACCLANVRPRTHHTTSQRRYILEKTSNMIKRRNVERGGSSALFVVVEDVSMGPNLDDVFGGKRRRGEDEVARRPRSWMTWRNEEECSPLTPSVVSVSTPCPPSESKHRARGEALFVIDVLDNGLGCNSFLALTGNQLEARTEHVSYHITSPKGRKYVRPHYLGVIFLLIFCQA